MNVSVVLTEGSEPLSELHVMFIRISESSDINLRVLSYKDVMIPNSKTGLNVGYQ